MTWENILKLNYDKYQREGFGDFFDSRYKTLPPIAQGGEFNPFAHQSKVGESRKIIEDWLEDHRLELIKRYRKELSKDYSKSPRSEFPNRALRGIGQMTTPKKIKAGTYIRGKKITEDITVPTEETIKLFNKNLLKRLESLHETLMRKLSNEEIIFYGQVLKKYANVKNKWFDFSAPNQIKNYYNTGFGNTSSKPAHIREDNIYESNNILQDWADIVKEYSLDTIEVEEIIEDVETGTSQTYGKFMGGKPKVTTRMGYGLQEEIDYRKKGEEE